MHNTMPSRSLPRTPYLPLPSVQRRFRSVSQFQASASSTVTSSDTPLSPTSLKSIPSLNVDYNQVDAEDPDFTLNWLHSFPIFGFSARSPDDPRYKAVAKFKKVVSQHDVADVAPSDFIRALSVYSSMLDRQAKQRTSDSCKTCSNSSQHSLSSTAAPDSQSDTASLTPTRRRRSFADVRSESLESSDSSSHRRLSLPEPIMKPQEIQHQLTDVLSYFKQRSPSDPPPHVAAWETLGSRTNIITPPLSPIEARSLKPVSASQVQLFYHMLRHAESIYGLPLNAASAPGISMTKLTDKGIICRRTGISSRDILTSQFSALAFLPAHYIAIDNQINAIVICIRGTANLIDSLTDVAATHDPLEIRRENGNGENDIVRGHGHSGVLRSARNLFEKIRSLTLQAVRQNPNHNLMITGHSLGAATASVLSMIMRDDPEFPRATAVCIAPPPCVTLELAEQVSSSTVTLVNGPDIVPRLSVAVMLPYFATARYVADLKPTQKAMVSVGLKGAVIDWSDLSQHTVQKVEQLRRQHEGRRLYIPGKVFQLVRKEEVSRRDAVKNKLFRKADVEIVPVHRSHFLKVGGREKGMFLAHAPFSYKANLVRLLNSMGSKPLRKTRSRTLRKISPMPHRPKENVMQRQVTSESLDSLFSIDEEDYARHVAALKQMVCEKV